MCVLASDHEKGCRSPRYWGNYLEGSSNRWLSLKGRVDTCKSSHGCMHLNDVNVTALIGRGRIRQVCGYFSESRTEEKPCAPVVVKRGHGLLEYFLDLLVLRLDLEMKSIRCQDKSRIRRVTDW